MILSCFCRLYNEILKGYNVTKHKSAIKKYYGFFLLQLSLFIIFARFH